MTPLIITPDLAEDLVVGSSLYGTGGGMPPAIQRSTFARLFAAGLQPQLVSIADLPAGTTVAAAYGVGSAGSSSVDILQQTRDAIALAERTLGVRIGALFAGETNIDAVVLETAASLGLPLLDADGTGGRAVPEITFDNMFLHGRSTVPAAIATADGCRLLLMDAPDGKAVERMVRAAAAAVGGSVAVVDHLLPKDTAAQALTHGVFARSLALGNWVRRHYGGPADLLPLLERMGGTLLATGTLHGVRLGDNAEGFYEGSYRIGDMTVYVKNEALVASRNGAVVAAAPDLLMLVDPTNGTGLHNSTLCNGRDAALAVVPADALWGTAAGRALFGPQCFPWESFL